MSKNMLETVREAARVSILKPIKPRKNKLEQKENCPTIKSFWPPESTQRVCPIPAWRGPKKALNRQVHFVLHEFIFFETEAVEEHFQRGVVGEAGADFF